MSTNPAWYGELIDLLRFASQDRKLFALLLEDLCTPEELAVLSRRWQIVKLLHKDTPHREIVDRLDVAIGTVTRGSRMLKNPTGGFARLIYMILTTKRPNGPIKAWRNQLME